jgi:hypothetical protein
MRHSGLKVNVMFLGMYRLGLLSFLGKDCQNTLGPEILVPEYSMRLESRKWPETTHSLVMPGHKGPAPPVSAQAESGHPCRYLLAR